ncbi:PREDICTED: uncharacterized protein LOC104747732 [Camelina sativa]|uniref:Uncharacterized protein LOC104747732 n=1 Tax=Camelina sativa TaxID=90675 RepID=A0ABM0W9Q7_CAMSA|nr:PREDICTED: uncharacterized protein LOC104747732 [Camelina sativa]
MMVVNNSFDLWQKDVFFPAAEEVQKSADIMESTYRLWIRDKKDEICKELQAALGTAKWQLEEFEKAVRLSHKRCGDDDSASRRRKQFVTAIENQIDRVETSLQEAYSENGKEPLRWIDLNEEERDDLAMFLSGSSSSSRTSQSFSTNSRESTTNSSLVDNLRGTNGVEVNCRKETIKKVKGCGKGSECVIDIVERVNADARIQKSAGMRRICSSPNFNSLRIIVPGGNEEVNERLVAQIEATPKVKGTKSVLWMQRLPDHNQLLDKTGCFQNPIRLPFDHPIKLTVSLMLMVFLLLPFVVYSS